MCDLSDGDLEHFATDINSNDIPCPVIGQVSAHLACATAKFQPLFGILFRLVFGNPEVLQALHADVPRMFR